MTHHSSTVRYGLGVYTIFLFLFLLAPIAVICIAAFNSAQYVTFPIESFSMRWFAALWQDPTILNALVASLKLGLATALICVTLGTTAAYAIARLNLPGARYYQLFLTLPILVPHLILGVGLLLAFRMLGLSRSFALLVAGHVALTLPFVIITILPRVQALPRALEEAAYTLGAGPLETFWRIVLPICWPAILAGGLLSFLVSFDEVTATLFWRPTGVETLPTQIMGMLNYSTDQRLNALGAFMTAISAGLPLIAYLVATVLRKKKDTKTS